MDDLAAQDLGLARRVAVVVREVEVRDSEVERETEAISRDRGVAVSPEREPGAERDRRKNKTAPACTPVQHRVVAAGGGVHCFASGNPGGLERLRVHAVSRGRSKPSA